MVLTFLAMKAMPALLAHPPGCQQSAGTLPISAFKTSPELTPLGGLCSVISECEQFLIYYSLSQVQSLDQQIRD